MISEFDTKSVVYNILQLLFKYYTLFIFGVDLIIALENKLILLEKKSKTCISTKVQIEIYISPLTKN